MIDNFNKIFNLIEDSREFCYFTQLITRPKDTGKQHKVIFSNGLSKSKLEKNKEDLIAMANATHSRIYINLNAKYYKKIVYELVKQSTELLYTDQFFSSVLNITNSALGRITAPDKVWIIDIDGEQVKDIESIKDCISRCNPVGDKVIDTLDTPNGVHLITRPFDLLESARYFNLCVT